jgi:C_GCAxxG_C_C family probable redox protein
LDRIIIIQRWMMSETRADRAEALFRQGYNCSQSVFAAFADVVGMSVEEAAQLASPFGAGFGKLREVCGAVSGMTMLAGKLKGYSDPKAREEKIELYKLMQKMCAEFEEKEGSIICRELLGLEKGEDLGEPAVRTEEYYRSRPCVGACRTAAEIAEKYLL